MAAYRMLSEPAHTKIVAVALVVLFGKRKGTAEPGWMAARKLFSISSPAEKKSTIVYRRKYQRPDGWVCG